MRRSGVQLPSAPPAFPHHSGTVISASCAVLQRPAPHPFFNARAVLAGERHDIDAGGQQWFDPGLRHLAPAYGAIGPIIAQQIFRDYPRQRTSTECHDPVLNEETPLYASRKWESVRQMIRHCRYLVTAQRLAGAASVPHGGKRARFRLRDAAFIRLYSCFRRTAFPTMEAEGL